MFAALKKYGVIISGLPIVQSGLLAIMKEHFPEYDMCMHQRVEELTIMQLRRTHLVLVDLSGDRGQGKALCEQYYSLMTQYKDIRWVFMVSHHSYPLAIEYLLRPESTLLSEAEPIDQLIRAIREKGPQFDHISTSLICPTASQTDLLTDTRFCLTASERQVLRLLAKGWGVNQIAMLLKKSNKTISAQKNSAMRRLALRGNAEMYAWINSAQGMKELNLLPAWGEASPWKSSPQKDMSLS